MESNDSPEIPDRGETSDIPGLPSEALKTTIKFLHKTLQLMMMYHPIKFGCKKISSSVDMVDKVISDYMCLQCDPEFQDSKPIFLHDTLAHDDA